jgi:hypothetical protein
MKQLHILAISAQQKSPYDTMLKFVISCIAVCKSSALPSADGVLVIVVFHGCDVLYGIKCLISLGRSLLLRRQLVKMKVTDKQRKESLLHYLHFVTRYRYCVTSSVTQKV